MREIRLRAIGYRLFAMLLCLIAWEAVSSSGLYNEKLFPPPSAVFKALCDYVWLGPFWKDATASLLRVAIGYLAGVVLGIGLGVLTGISKRAALTVGFILQLIRPIPPISFVPLAVLWFGIGAFSKYFLVFLGVFFPIWMNSHLGISQVEAPYIWASQSMGATKLSQIFHVYLPGAAPLIVAGLRVAIAIGFYCLVAAEIAGAFSGLAFRVEIAHLNTRVDQMIAGLICLGIFSALSDWGLEQVIKYVFPWASRSQTNAA